MILLDLERDGSVWISWVLELTGELLEEFHWHSALGLKDAHDHVTLQAKLKLILSLLAQE